MIKSIRLKNFFSFKEATIDLHPNLNVLIGINGSGKSNLFKVIHLLKEGVAGIGLKHLILNTWGGFKEVLFAGRRGSDTIEIEFVLDGEKVRQYGYFFKEDIHYRIELRQVPSSVNFSVSERLYLPRQTQRDFIYIELHDGKGVLNECKDDDMLSLVRYNDFDAQELALSKIFDTDRYFQIATVRKAIAELVVYNHFDTTPQSHIRRPMLPTSEKRLLSDGSNLPQMLNTLKINDKPSFSALRETLRNINEQFTDIDFNFIGGNIELMLAEEKLNRSIHVSHLSDGTLRFLCLMSIFFNRERGALVCIDEPEIGLHPDMIHTMIQSLKESATETQFILTTHSAHFLDYFDFEHIRIVEKDEHNASRVAQYTKEDFKGWYEEFSLGKMWRAGDLGGNRW